MWAKLAYPNGEARELVNATSARGKRIARDGKTEGTELDLGVLQYRYTKPDRKAKEDCMVLRKTGYLKREGEDGGP